MKIGHTLPDTIYSWEGWIFNLLCAFYFAFISPFVKDTSIATVQEENTTAIGLGILLIIVSILEIYAFPKKMKYVHRAVKDHGGESGTGFVLWMFHAVISIIIVFVILSSFGLYDTAKDAEESGGEAWLGILMMIVVIKELYLLFTIMGIHDNHDPLEDYKRPNKKEWILDLILLVYACLAYTVTWEAMIQNTNMEKQNTVMYIVNLFVAGLLFLMFYMPIRIPYYLEEMAQLKTTKNVLKFVLGILIVLIAVVTNL